MDIPPACRQHQSTVALLDCLQNEQEILKQVLGVQELTAKIQEIEAAQDISNAPAASLPEASVAEDPSESSDSDVVLERIAWFDQHLEVYAVVGTSDSLTAFARMEGREYRIKTGDAIRLARVLDVHSRGIELSVSGHEFSIGLSGSRKTQKQNSESGK